MTVLIRIMFRNLKGYRFLVIFIFIVTFLEVLATANNLVVIKDIFNALGTPPREPSSPFNYLLNWFDPLRPGQKHPTTTIITFLIIMLVVLGLLDSALTYVQLFLTSRIAQNLSARLRKKLFDQLQRLSLHSVAAHDLQRRALASSLRGYPLLPTRHQGSRKEGIQVPGRSRRRCRRGRRRHYRTQSLLAGRPRGHAL
ncbi:MAG: ABC transporter ATP-binding protein [Chloroflexi bacterium]|nr:MAG: ABC transporter ATP-binding protein [Chloroflexota bacterium]